MPDHLTLALCQLNPVVGDVRGNTVRIADHYRAAVAQGATLCLTPELSVCGYPPEDLVRHPGLIAACAAAVADLAALTADQPTGLVVGLPWLVGGQLYNAALLCADGQIVAHHYKHDLPNYGVFDEKRVFAAAPLPQPWLWRDVRWGMLICEDYWTAAPAAYLRQQGAEILLTMNGSPFEITKQARRLALMAARGQETGLPAVMVNQVGGQDELVFDGQSFAMNPDGQVAAAAPAFTETTLLVTLRASSEGWRCVPAALPAAPDETALLYQALVVGVRDYARKNGFASVVLGLSGGVDSALVACLAADALGPAAVTALLLPSPYTAPESLADAQALAVGLGVRHETVPITPLMAAVETALRPHFSGRAVDVTEENIQSRLRGLALMAWSNKFGSLLLSTGNKSELAVGYATLYGDMCGGFAPLKDVYKGDVYRLAAWRTQQAAVIPPRILSRAPTAELRPNQTDQDNLPPYPELDAILHCLVERDWDLATTLAAGHDPATVRRVRGMVDRAEYKRRQAPPGVKVSNRAFGRDRRWPVTNRFTES